MTRTLGYVWHLRTKMAEKGLSLHTLAALCDILDVTPNDLIEITVVARQVRKTATGHGTRGAPTARRTTIRRPDGA